MLKLAMLLALAAGCAHQETTTSGGIAGADDQFGRAYETVASGSKQSAHGGGYLIERAGDNTVRVVREAPAGGLGRDVSDAWITAKIKGKLAADGDVKSREVHVHTDAGMVTLEGNVPSREQALKALRDTLNTDGVTAVDSQLQFPEQLRAGANSTRF